MSTDNLDLAHLRHIADIDARRDDRAIRWYGRKVIALLDRIEALEAERDEVRRVLQGRLNRSAELYMEESNRAVRAEARLTRLIDDSMRGRLARALSDYDEIYRDGGYSAAHYRGEVEAILAETRAVAADEQEETR